MKINKITWTNRYSQDDKPDKLGRWARVGYLEHISKDPFKTCQIAWINKVDDTFLTSIYVGDGNFSGKFTELEKAKEYCQEILNNFYNDYLKPK